MTAADLVVAQLEALLSATPLPPADAEPDQLLADYAAIAATRDCLIAALAEVAAGAAGDPRVRAHYQELVQRDRAWTDALTRARLVVGERLTAVRRARAYR